MRKIPFIEFERLMKPIEKYQEDYNDCANGLNLICKDSYAVPSLGANLLDNYIDLLEGYLEMDNQMLNWFVFDNEYGTKKMGVKHSDNESFTEISCLEDLYNFLTNF